MRSLDKFGRGFRLTVELGLLLALCASSPLSAQDLAAPALRNDDQGQPAETVVVTAPKPDNPEYRLGPTDKLRITVYGEDDLSGEFQIDSAGNIRMPLIGGLKAAGLTAEQLGAQIENALDNGYLNDGRVAVEVSEYRPFYIIGQVNKPGEYPYVSNMSALNAIALAGGFTEKAVESTIYVRHEGEIGEHPIATGELTRINPGDVVRVSETTFWDVADVISPFSAFGYIIATAATP